MIDPILLTTRESLTYHKKKLMHESDIKSKKQRGFTLVELIIVIVILGILLALGIGSFSSSQNRSKKEGVVAVADKVKLNLDSYFNEKDRYPLLQSDVTAYLTQKGDTASAAEFGDTAKFGYTATTATGTTCANTGTNKCEKYTITVKKATWAGGTSDTDVLVTP